MTKGPAIGSKITATVKHVKGHCDMEHKVGDTFEPSCFDSDGLCGFFYHQIYPDLQTLQFGGQMPWWGEDTVEVGCSDMANQVTLVLKRTPRTEA